MDLKLSQQNIFQVHRAESKMMMAKKDNQMVENPRFPPPATTSDT